MCVYMCARACECVRECVRENVNINRCAQKYANICVPIRVCVHTYMKLNK